VTKFMAEFWPYVETLVGDPSFLAYLPEWLRNAVIYDGVQAALALEAWATGPYTEEWFIEEMQGLSDASGVPYDQILHIHMIGELTKGACSMTGAWGPAIPPGNGLFQFRALDWDVTGPYKNYPAVVVYHPTPGTGNGHAFANVGFGGWIGSITGMSSVPMAINEIGVSFPDDTFGAESRFGIPFTFILRDILQFDEELDDTINRLMNAHRTCDLILGAGDGNAQTFRAFQYSASVLNVVDDTNLIPDNDTWHPKIPGVVYYGMDWLCPGYDLALANQIHKYYGNITAEVSIRYITPIVQTGNLHVAVYDYPTMTMFVSFAAGTNETGPLYAYDRQFTALNMNALFDEPAPVSKSHDLIGL